MGSIQEGKLYGPKDRGLIRHYVETFVIFTFTCVGFYVLGGLTYQHGIQYWFTFESYKIFKFAFLTFGIWFFLYLIYSSIFWCNYGIITEKSVIGLNGYRIKRGEMVFDEIVEMRSHGKVSYDILLINKNGEKLILAPSIYPADEFFNEIIKRSKNVRRIDLRYVRKYFQKYYNDNLILYEKGLDKGK